MKTLVLRVDPHLPHSYTIASPSGKTRKIGVNRKTGEDVLVVLRYKFPAGAKVQVEDEDYPLLRNLMWRRRGAGGGQLAPLFGGAEDVIKGLTPQQQIAKLTERLEGALSSLAEAGVIELPEDEKEESTDDGIIICSGCGNVYPPGYKGLCYRCKTEIK